MSAVALAGAPLAALKVTCVSTSIALMASGAPAAVAMWRTQSLGAAGVLPLALMWLDNVIGIWFSALVDDGLGGALRVAATVLATAYLAVYFAVADPARRRADAPVALACVASPALLFASFRTLAWPSEVVVNALGLINTLTAVAFASSPLAGIRTVLKERDASSIPLAMVATLAVCAAAWGLYGAVLGSGWMIAPNALNFALAAMQLALVAVLGQRGAKTVEPAKPKAE